MDKYKETFETWNKVAKLYQDKFMDLDLYDDTYDAFCEEITKVNPTILEIGCGPGNITKYLLNKRPDFKIEAIDIAPNMINLAKLNNPTTSFRVMDTRNIDQLAPKFDGIICGFCLPYLSETDCIKLIQDFKYLLSNKGVIYMSFVEGDYTKSDFQTGSSGDRTFFYYHHLDVIQRELKKQSFDTINVLYKKYITSKGTEEFHTILIAK